MKLNFAGKHYKILAGVFLAGFLGGILWVNISDVYLNQAGLLSNYFLSQYKYMELDLNSFFFYVLGKRLKWILLLWFLGYTVAGLPFGLLFVAWLGCSAGVVITMAVLKLGMFGVLFFLVSIIPQYLFYVPATVVFLKAVYEKSLRRFQGKSFQSGRKDKWEYAGILMVTMGIMLLGILTESYINPWLVKQFLIIST